MAVPTILTDLSATAASNSPSGSETVGSGLDDYLRGIQASIRGGLAHKGADIASATNMDLGAVAGLFHDITGTTTVESFGTVSIGIWKVLKFEGALILTHDTQLLLPGLANITTAAGDMCMATSEGSGNWRVNWYVKAASTPFGVLGDMQVHTLTGTWTKPAGLTRALVRVQAPGGGGGGADSDGGGTAGGGGGGAGGFTEKLIEASALGATETVTVGSVGAAGSTSGGTGGTGGTTSFGAHLSCTGGVGGAGTGIASTTGTARQGGAGGAGSLGDINVLGSDGGNGIGAGNVAIGGVGGSSFFGGGGRGGATDTSDPGVAGQAYGSGGGGGAIDLITTGVAGGAGGPGIVIVYEFF